MYFSYFIDAIGRIKLLKVIIVVINFSISATRGICCKMYVIRWCESLESTTRQYVLESWECGPFLGVYFGIDWEWYVASNVKDPNIEKN